MTINLSKNESAVREFRLHLTTYTMELLLNRIGWNVSFLHWLEVVHGWKHLGDRRFEKIPAVKTTTKVEPQ